MRRNVRKMEFLHSVRTVFRNPRAANGNAMRITFEQGIRLHNVFSAGDGDVIGSRCRLVHPLGSLGNDRRTIWQCEPRLVEEGFIDRLNVKVRRSKPRGKNRQEYPSRDHSFFPYGKSKAKCADLVRVLTHRNSGLDSEEVSFFAQSLLDRSNTAPHNRAKFPKQCVSLRVS